MEIVRELTEALAGVDPDMAVRVYYEGDDVGMLSPFDVAPETRYRVRRRGPYTGVWSDWELEDQPESDITVGSRRREFRRYNRAADFGVCADEDLAIECDPIPVEVLVLRLTCLGE